MQGVSLLDVAKTHGTPLYVYDAQTIQSQIQSLQQAFKGLNVRLKYAAKALTNINILKLMRHQGIELDCVSVQEVRLGLKAGFAPAQILYTPNGVSFAEIQEAVSLGVQVNIDNIAVLEHFGHTYGNTVPLCVRLNPGLMAGGNFKISTGHIDSKFGISVMQMRHLLTVIEKYNIDVVGLHVHTGSDIVETEVFLKGAEIMFDAARNFKNLRFIDFGSGFKVAYREGDIVTRLNDLGQQMAQTFKDFCQEYGRDLEIWFEPGKYLVSNAGVFLVRTNVVKPTPVTVFAGVDSGLNHLLRPMMYDAYHEMVNISNPEGVERVYTVVGYICETDTFGADRRLNEVHENDIIAIKNAGAYGFSMASNYNSRYRPAEVLIHNGQAKLIRKRETFDDILRNQVEVEL